ncbi:MAG TPA: hypothetical protein VNL36_01055 [Bacteroidota bacterium]|nr:hypothetical protein [Bacteroidota bacterium]
MPLRDPVTIRLLVDDLQLVKQLLQRTETEMAELDEARYGELKLLFIKERISEARTRLENIQEVLQTIHASEEGWGEFIEPMDVRE